MFVLQIKELPYSELLFWLGFILAGFSAAFFLFRMNSEKVKDLKDLKRTFLKATSLMTACLCLMFGAIASDTWYQSLQVKKPFEE